MLFSAPALLWLFVYDCKIMLNPARAELRLGAAALPDSGPGRRVAILEKAEVSCSPCERLQPFARALARAIPGSMKSENTASRHGRPVGAAGGPDDVLAGMLDNDNQGENGIQRCVDDCEDVEAARVARVVNEQYRQDGGERQNGVRSDNPNAEEGRPAKSPSA